MLPEGWSQKSLEQISIGKLTNGVFNDPKLVGNGYRLINVVDLYNPLYIDVSNLKRLAIPKKEFEKYKALKGDLFFTRSSLKLDGIAHCARLTDDFDDIIYDCHIMRLRCNHDEIDSNFLYEYCNSYPARKHFMRYAKTGTMTTIDQAGVSTLVVPLPPLPEQKKIAQILSTWDNAISATERLLENSQQRKKALMQQLLTGKKRLPGFEGEFKHVELSGVASITMGTSPKSESYNEEGDGLPLIQGNADIECRKSKPRIFTSEVTKTCFPGDILLSVRAPVGTIAISNHEACIGRGICALRATKGNNQDYLYQWMLWYEPRWSSLSQGSTFESVNSTDIKSLKLILPSFIEQQAIANILTTADQEIDALQKRLEHLKLEKKALMQQLLTGKRRVVADVDAA